MRTINRVLLQSGDYILFALNFTLLKGKGKGQHSGFCETKIVEEMVMLYDPKF